MNEEVPLVANDGESWANKHEESWQTVVEIQSWKQSKNEKTKEKEIVKDEHTGVLAPRYSLSCCLFLFSFLRLPSFFPDPSRLRGP